MESSPLIEQHVSGVTNEDKALAREKVEEFLSSFTREFQVEGGGIYCFHLFKHGGGVITGPFKPPFSAAEQEAMKAKITNLLGGAERLQTVPAFMDELLSRANTKPKQVHTFGQLSVNGFHHILGMSFDIDEEQPAPEQPE